MCVCVEVVVGGDLKPSLSKLRAKVGGWSVSKRLTSLPTAALTI